MTPAAGRISVATLAVALVCGFAAPAFASPAGGSALARAGLTGRGHYLHRGAHGEADVNVCTASTAPGYAQCSADIRTDVFDDSVEPTPSIPGVPGAPVNPGALGNNGAYDPAFLQSAYDAPSTNGAGQTVAIVDAYDAPLVAADLTVYRAYFDLPPCTLVNGCFRKVNQTGGLVYPAPNVGWARETTLDVQMVSALCPNCKILLIEANSNSMTDLGTAVNLAVALGADVVSNSYGAGEFATETQADHYFDHPGVAIVASSGDNGYGVEYPAASPHVIAVGGTSLYQATATGTRNATETVWSGAGSGCSAYEPKPAWQTDSGCPRRTVADVSAVADPSTGVWVYNSTDGGWEIFGGTSVAAPIVGALYALAGNGQSAAEMGSLPYATPGAFNDVVAGTNGSCGGTYLCTGVTGYDGPTGLGTPDSVAGLSLSGSDLTPAPAPDFSVAATALHASMRPGQTAKSTVAVAPRNGFTGNVDLSVAVRPARGLSARFGTSTLTVGASAASTKLTFAARAGGKYVVTITGKHGARLHKVMMTVMVNDFSMKLSPAQATVERGNRVRFTLKLASRGAFNGSVKLSVSGLPARDTVMYVHDPAAASSSQTITITTSAQDAPGRLTLRFVGVSGALRHAVTVKLSVE